MNEDLISRQEAIKYIENIQNLEDYYRGKRAKHRFSLKRIICVLNDVPSVPSVPTERTGHWIYRDGEGIYFNLYSCSECGALCGTPTYNYCPNCGARMVSKDEAD